MSLDIGSGPPPPPLYERVGGHDFFVRLVDEFYNRVEADTELLSHYPDLDDLQGARHRLAMFLEQFWGGPTTYAEQRGHPRLRMRHAPYAVGPVVRDEWMLCMTQALTEQVTDRALRDRLLDTFSQMADHLVNTHGSHSCSATRQESRTA